MNWVYGLLSGPCLSLLSGQTTLRHGRRSPSLWAALHRATPQGVEDLAWPLGNQFSALSSGFDVSPDASEHRWTIWSEATDCFCNVGAGPTCLAERSALPRVAANSKLNFPTRFSSNILCGRRRGFVVPVCCQQLVPPTVHARRMCGHVSWLSCPCAQAAPTSMQTGASTSMAPQSCRRPKWAHVHNVAGCISDWADERHARGVSADTWLRWVLRHCNDTNHEQSEHYKGRYGFCVCVMQMPPRPGLPTDCAEPTIKMHGAGSIPRTMQ